MLLRFRRACVFFLKDIYIYIYTIHILYIYGTPVVSLLSSDHHFLEDVLTQATLSDGSGGLQSPWWDTALLSDNSTHLSKHLIYVCTWKYDENPR